MALMPSPGRRPAVAGPHRPPDGPRLWSVPAASSAAASSALEATLEEFTRRWQRGESPRAEEYLDRLPADDPDGPLELIYHEFCLASSSGRRPDAEAFAVRFPAHRERLLRLIALHDALPASAALGEAPGPALPEAGDAVGPFLLVRELGRGGFARVYLAADADLEDRLVVLKITDRPSAEHRYLARAPHPHVVPILRERTTEDGLQLIFMPFLGGATLAEVLAEGRLRPRRAVCGRDLLDDLDRRSAPEYPAAVLDRPARELIGPLSYPRAIAWLVARLAEGLDHAYERGVTHGDLKPSNVLVAADGTPLLLDFNLSTDWRPAAPSAGSSDPGGTLAYMAPERLRAIAEAATAPPSPEARHRADLYALGLILRESLLGVPPHVPDPATAPRSARALAARLAAERSGPDPIGRTSLGSIPPGLRAILRRCLAPDPLDRYRRASELAHDLDRWRADLPLVHAPIPRRVALARRLRTHRRPLLAAGFCVALGVGGAIVAATFGTLKAEAATVGDALTAQYEAKLESFLSGEKEGVYYFRPNRPDHILPRETNVWALERLLGAYDAFDPSGGDLRRRPDIAGLSEPDRSDLIAWLNDLALRYGIAVSRPEFDSFPEDRRKALTALDRLIAGGSAEPLVRVANHLRDQLGVERSERSPASSPVPGWLSAFLDGVAAETFQLTDAEAIEIGAGSIGVEAALQHFAVAVEGRPELYWPRYRLATASGLVRDFDTAAAAFDRCLEARPGCAPLWVAYGSSLFHLGNPDRAAQAYQRAQDLAPASEEVLSALAYLWAREEGGDSVSSVLERFKVRARPGRSAAVRRLALLTSLIEPGPAVPAGADPTWRLSVLREAHALDEQDIVRTYAVARELQIQGKLVEALDIYSDLLEAEPDHLAARFNRGILLQQMGRKAEALDDYRAIADHPNAVFFLDAEPAGLMIYPILSADAIRRGLNAEAIELAEEASRRASQVGRYFGESHYARARAYAAAAEADPAHLQHAADALIAAQRVHGDFIAKRFAADPVFARRRSELIAMIDAFAL